MMIFRVYIDAYKSINVSNNDIKIGQNYQKQNIHNISDIELELKFLFSIISAVTDHSAKCKNDLFDS